MASKLAQMQARFQQKQLQEKEEKLLKLYENQQQRTIERVSRGSAGSDNSVTTATTNQGGKVRQMFDERRQKAGIDRSYPLEPLKTTRSNGFLRTNIKTVAVSTKTVMKSTLQKKNSKPVVNKHYNNDDDENYKEQCYEDDNANDFSEKREELVNMMNDHNLNESLDDEELPSVGIDEFDEPAFTGKLANVGGKLPSQNGKQGEQRTGVINGKVSTTPVRKETKLVVKKTVVKTQSSPKHSPSLGSPYSSQSSTPKASTPSSPIKSTAAMSAKRPHPSSRAPSTQRPSGGRLQKGAMSVVARDDLESCKFCNRRFASERLQIHEEICARTAKKKRKAYDAVKHRVQGTELEPFVRRGKGTAKARPASAAKKANWRQTHDDFISTIRAAKQAQQHVARGGKLSDLPPPPPSSNPDYIQCPHCGRRFNQSAADRHIPKCASYAFNKTKPGAAAPKGKGVYR